MNNNLERLMDYLKFGNILAFFNEADSLIEDIGRDGLRSEYESLKNVYFSVVQNYNKGTISLINYENTINLIKVELQNLLDLIAIETEYIESRNWYRDKIDYLWEAAKKINWLNWLNIYATDVADLRIGKDIPQIEIYLERNFWEFSEKDLVDVLEIIRENINYQDKVRIIDVLQGSVRILLEIEKHDAERLFLLAKKGELESVSILNAKIVGSDVDYSRVFDDLQSKTYYELNEIEKEVLEIKREIAENLEVGMDRIETIIKKGSREHDDYLIIKGEISNVKRYFNFGFMPFTEFNGALKKALHESFELLNRIVRKYHEVDV